MRLAKADIMANETCTSCHNSHPASPRRDWKVGDVRGALAVSIPIGAMESQIVGRFGTAALLLAVCIAIGAAWFYWVARGVRQPLEAVVAAAEFAVKNDDFTQDVPVAGTRETARAGQALNALLRESSAPSSPTPSIQRDASPTPRAHWPPPASRSHRSSAAQAESSSSVAAAVEQASVSVSETAANAKVANEIVGKARAGVDRALAEMAATVGTSMASPN
jgi:methyl-accepting chemotaxis protein